MSDPVAVILRFKGDSHDLLEGFEQARRSWIEDQDDGFKPPAFFVMCATEEGITVITGWDTDEDHRAFAHGMGPRLERAGAPRPDGHEHLRIAKLGWSPTV